MPDDRLLDLADEDRLRKQLDAEIERMLASPRAAEFVSNFTGQWLQLRDLGSVSPSRNSFPKFDQRLQSSMRRETEMLFAHMIRENLTLATLLDADFTFADEKLARFYGIEDVKGDTFCNSLSWRRRKHRDEGSSGNLKSAPIRAHPWFQ